MASKNTSNLSLKEKKGKPKKKKNEKVEAVIVSYEEEKKKNEEVEISVACFNETVSSRLESLTQRKIDLQSKITLLKELTFIPLCNRRDESSDS